MCIIPLVGVEGQLAAGAAQVQNLLLRLFGQTHLIDQTDRQLLIVELLTDELRRVSGQRRIGNIHIDRLVACGRIGGHRDGDFRQIDLPAIQIGILYRTLVDVHRIVFIGADLGVGIVNAVVAEHRGTLDLHTGSDVVHDIHGTVLIQHEAVGRDADTALVDFGEDFLQLLLRQIAEVGFIRIAEVVSVGVGLEHRLISMGNAVPSLGEFLIDLNIIIRIGTKEHSLELVNGDFLSTVGGQVFDDIPLGIQHRTLVVITGVGSGAGQGLIIDFVDAHTNGIEHNRLLILDADGTLIVVCGQHRIVTVNTLAVAATALAVAVVGSLEYVVVDRSGVGRLTVGQQDEHRLTGDGIGSCVLTLTQGGGVGDIVANGLEYLITHGDTGLRVGTDTLIPVGTHIGVGHTALASQGGSALKEVDVQVQIRWIMGIVLLVVDQILIIICGVAIQRKHLPCTAGIDCNTHTVCFVVIQNLLHRGVNRVTQIHDTLGIGVVIVDLRTHTAGDIQHEHHVHRGLDHILVRNLIFLSQRGQRHTEGVGLVTVKGSVVIGAVNNGLIGDHLAVDGGAGFKAFLTELVFDIGGGRVGVILTLDGGTPFRHRGLTGQATGGDDELAVIGLIRGNGLAAAAGIVIAQHIRGNGQTGHIGQLKDQHILRVVVIHSGVVIATVCAAGTSLGEGASTGVTQVGVVGDPPDIFRSDIGQSQFCGNCMHEVFRVTGNKGTTGSDSGQCQIDGSSLIADHILVAAAGEGPVDVVVHRAAIGIGDGIVTGVPLRIGIPCGIRIFLAVLSLNHDTGIVVALVATEGETAFCGDDHVCTAADDVGGAEHTLPELSFLGGVGQHRREGGDHIAFKAHAGQTAGSVDIGVFLHLLHQIPGFFLGNTGGALSGSIPGVLYRRLGFLLRRQQIGFHLGGTLHSLRAEHRIGKGDAHRSGGSLRQ